MREKLKQWWRELKCFSTGHVLLQQRYSYYKFEHLDSETWLQECVCCKKPIFCISRFVKTDRDFICMVELDITLEEMKKYPYPYNLIK